MPQGGLLEGPFPDGDSLRALCPAGEGLPPIALGTSVALSGPEEVPCRRSTPTAALAGEGVGRETQA